MWQRFTESARKTVFYAQEEAGEVGQNFVGPEHFLLGLTHHFKKADGVSREEPNAAILLLQQLGVDVPALEAETRKRLVPGDGRLKQDMQLTPSAKKVIDLSYDEATRLKHNYIGTEHILLGMLRERVGIALKDIASDVLAGFGVTLESAREQLRQKADEDAANLLSLDEAVKFLGTSRPTLYRLLGQDEIKGLKVGRQWRFRKADLVAYMERGPVAVSAAPSEDLDRELVYFAGHLRQSAGLTGDPEAKTARLAHQIVALAIQSQASDIHLEPTPDNLLLRFRISGALQESRWLPSRIKESLTAQFKTLADMNLGEIRLPQDGRMLFQHDGKDFNLRVSTLPSLHGEAMTLRIFDRSRVPLGLEQLGLTPEDLAQIRGVLTPGNGIVLAAGPAGGGKTTLLYSCVHDTASPEKRTLTVEDPVESVLAFTTQVPVSKKSGLTTAIALRAFLRQDPDMLMVGRLDDLEVTFLAVDAAQAGHLVLCGLEADDAASALVRLLELGMEPPLLTQVVKAVIAVRLCRRLCEHCKAPLDPETAAAFLSAFPLPSDAALYEKRGCDRCRGQGYLGHLGLYEILPMTEPVAEAIFRGRPAAEISAAAEADGMKTLLADGLGKAAAGLTTVEEALFPSPRSPLEK